MEALDILLPIVEEALLQGMSARKFPATIAVSKAPGVSAWQVDFRILVVEGKVRVMTFVQSFVPDGGVFLDLGDPSLVNDLRVIFSESD